jgi:hypothetical protein
MGWGSPHAKYGSTFRPGGDALSLLLTSKVSPGFGGEGPACCQEMGKSQDR